jgi:CO/xanthine dehydrogenase Mo-binding subunit
VRPKAKCGTAEPARRRPGIRIDNELGLLRVARIVSAVHGGRILNEKLARSPIVGAVVMGIGMTLFEATVSDADTGRVANATFGDYLIQVNGNLVARAGNRRYLQRWRSVA